MVNFNRPRVFSPHELEIIERAYAAAWTEIAAQNPDRDTSKDEELKFGLRKRLLSTAKKGLSDPDGLRDKVLRGLPKHWLEDG
jgi:hypothetical protein